MVKPSSETGLIREFCQKSSIKGLAKAMNTHRRGLRVLWCTAVLVGGTIASYLVTHILLEYLSNPVRTVTKIEQEHTAFPDVTVCNLQGIKSSSRKIFKKSYSSRSQMFENAIENISYVGYSSDDMILKCEWSNAKVDGAITKECTKEHIHKLVHPMYFNCYTIHLGQDKMHLLGLLLYTDDFIETIDENESFDWNAPMEKGMILVVHPSGTYPDMSEGIYLSTGNAVRIDIDRHQRELNPSLAGNCTDQEYLNMSMFQSSCEEHMSQTYLMDARVDASHNLTTENNSFQYVYSKAGCNLFRLQQQTIQLCGCISRRYPCPKSLRDNYYFCGSDKYFEKLRGKNFTLNSDNPGNVDEQCAQKYVSCECPPPCKELAFKYSVHQAVWPHEAYQEAWYKSIDKKIPKEFRRQRRKLFDRNKSAPMDQVDCKLQPIKQILLKQQKNDLFRRNFLKVQVRYASQYVTMTTDERAFTINSFMGSLGGVLNLWIGISLVTLFELLELCYRLIMKEEENNIVQVLPASNGQNNTNKQSVTK